MQVYHLLGGHFFITNYREGGERESVRDGREGREREERIRTEGRERE